MTKKIKVQNISDIFLENATVTEDGLMSKEDKEKVDTLVDPDAFEELIEALGSAVKLWWKCEDALGTTTLADASGNGKTGAVSGASMALRLPSLVGAGYSAGLSSAASTNISAPTGLPGGVTSLLLVWLPNGVADFIVNSAPSIAVEHDTLNANGSLRTLFNGSQVNATASGTFGAARTLIVITCDSSNNYRIYSDGILRAGPTAGSFATWSSFVLAGTGRVQHLVVTNTELTAAQIAAFYAAVPRL